MDPGDERREALLDMMVEGQAPSTGPIRLAAYDPEWPARFEEEKSRISTALGPTARTVEHVGSTSVPGLIAKPIIDIVLVVPDSSDEARYVPPLQRAHYILRIRERDWHDRVLRGAIIRSNVHVFSEDCPEIERMLLFRDRLRNHPDDRDLYAAQKRTLASRQWAFVQDYADAKSGVVEEILTRAGVRRPGPEAGYPTGLQEVPTVSLLRPGGGPSSDVP